jgi:hypothetical protein
MATTAGPGPSGGLVDGCHQLKNGVGLSNELILGDYFLQETALSLAEHLNTSQL